jgi:hypothetical protein
MYHIGRERLKAYILLVLIVVSIIQVGILWDYQSHGFPTSFFAAFFESFQSSDEDSPENARKEYFQPYRIIVSNGDETHWPIDRGDDLFDRLWEEASYCLAAALENEPAVLVPVGEWGNLVRKKNIVYEFKSTIVSDLFKWFLDKPDAETPFAGGVFKMAVAPWDDFNNFNTLYIMNEEEIYRYTIKFNAEGWQRQQYDEFIRMLEESSKYSGRTYRVTSENDPHGKMPSVDRDILFATYPARYRPYGSLSWDVPENVSSLSGMAEIVLGSEMASFHRSKDTYDTIVFKTNEKLYRIYSNGLLEYKYIPGSQPEDRSKAGEAFLNAFKFINPIEKYMVSGAGLYLSGMKEVSEGIFEFTFDYMAGEMPVVINLSARGNDAADVRHAIVVKADGRRVLECRWLFKDFRFSSRTEYYSVFIEDRLFSPFSLFSSLSNSSFSASISISSSPSSRLDMSMDTRSLLLMVISCLKA